MRLVPTEARRMWLIWQLTTFCYSCSRDLLPSSGLCEHDMHVALKIHAHKIKINKFNS